ncbi:MAG TPA: phage tail tube protein [Phycisphaerae bacterium]|mgnify:FL=1|nr:phage tail tube protein [Phycisphaerae bacterium]
MPNFVLGMNAKLYHGTAGNPASTELTNVRNVTLNLEAGEADVTTRANLGWRATAPTLRECSVDFEMVWDPADAGFTAIKNAFLTNGLIALKVLDQANGQGPDGDFSITSFTRSEELEEALTVSVTAKLAVFRSWVEGT